MGLINVVFIDIFHVVSLAFFRLVALMVEHRSPKPSVGGSSPS